MKNPASKEPPQPAPVCKELELGAAQIVMDWPIGALVARVHEVDIIPSFQQRLRQEGFLHWNVRHMGADLVLLSSPSADLTHFLVSEGSERLTKWLTEMRPWSSTEVSHKSFVASRVDDCTKRRDSFAMARVLILTAEVEPVMEVVRVKVGDLTFSIRVVEETGGDWVWQGSDMLSEELDEVGKSDPIFGGPSKTPNRVSTTPDGDASGNFDALLNRGHTHVTRRARGTELAQTVTERLRVACGKLSEAISAASQEAGAINAQGERKAILRSAKRERKNSRVDHYATSSVLAREVFGRERKVGPTPERVLCWETMGWITCAAQMEACPICQKGKRTAWI
ncbi:hypothetical protein Ancab_000847 [Ancistrocladus abbreviatus]